MINFELHTPTRVIFGKDTQLEAGRIIKEYGFNKVLLYYGGQSCIKSGLMAQIKKTLQENGVSFSEKGGVQPNPTLGFCRETAEYIKREGFDLILVVGGGSALDSAKIAAHSVATGADPWDIVTKKAPVTATMPFGVVLTIAAAGSETSDSAVLSDETTGTKRGLGTPFNRPLFAIMNPELTYTVPPYQTAAGIVDIMMHTLERYLAQNENNDLADRLAEGLVKSVIGAGRIVMENPRDYEARATLMWAGSLSHNGLMGAGKKYGMNAHQLEHEMSGLDEKITHGAGLAVVWPAYLTYLSRYNLKRLVQYAVRIWNCEEDFEHPERTVRAGIEATKAYFKSLGMPLSLADVGIGEDKIEFMAEKCTFFGERKLQSFIELGKEEITEIYRLCL
jgi:alcohol dehydrogenase YqhD (iron-dependent ADH family)